MSVRSHLLAAAAVTLVLASPAVGQESGSVGSAAEQSDPSIVVVATRTILPPSALPLTIDVIDVYE